MNYGCYDIQNKVLHATLSTFCLQNSDFVAGFSIRPTWDAYKIHYLFE